MPFEADVVLGQCDRNDSTGRGTGQERGYEKMPIFYDCGAHEHGEKIRQGQTNESTVTNSRQIFFHGASFLPKLAKVQ